MPTACPRAARQLTRSTGLGAHAGPAAEHRLPDPLHQLSFPGPHPLTPQCFKLALTTEYNASIPAVTSLPGFEVDVPDFTCNSTRLTTALPTYQALGYELGRTLWCAPFDWRTPSLGSGLFFQRVQALIERVGANISVDLVSGSLGPQMVLAFLHRMTPAWKSRYIRWFVAESPIWSGAPLFPLALASGFSNTPNSSLIEDDFNRIVSSGIHTTLWLFPRAGSDNSTWNDTEPIVTTPDAVFTASNLSAMVAGLGFEARAAAVQPLQAEPDLSVFAAPGVNTFVVYGTNLSTPGSFVFSANFKADPLWMPPQPRVLDDPAGGDTLVPVRSARRSLYAWSTAQHTAGRAFYSKGYAGMAHGLCIVNQTASAACFTDVVQLLLEGRAPKGLDVV